MRVLAILLTVLAGFLLLATAAHAHPGNHDGDASSDSHHHDGTDHDPADHTHPIGDDTYHQKASHNSFDVAHDLRLSELKYSASAREVLPPHFVREGGIDVVPPVPPPLG